MEYGEPANLSSVCSPYPSLDPPASNSYKRTTMTFLSLSGWDNFLLILTKPDNIPIVMMIAAVSFFTWMSLREAGKNDKLIEEGRRDEVLRRMKD